ncbi:ATP-grasp fold amidoligase family protein [Pseudoalteromonas sp. AOP31-A2-14]|uniref:ATP-grasp fold amidoligase family protein n=1 Tax=Pseudoalteromonas sp. AOP31-A2-14 TaxID=3457695 RepID=UPI004036EA6E
MTIGKKLITKACSMAFSVSFYNKLRFFYKHKKWPNLDTPSTFSEKFLKYKLSYFSPKMTICADKYAVRGYVESKASADILIPLIARFNSLKEFKTGYKDLLSSFALKAAHGSGWSEIVFNKNNVDYKLLEGKVQKWLSQNYYDSGFEKQYKDIPPSIVVEELLLSNDGKVPVDYKFYCFGKGGSKKIIVQVDIDRFDFFINKLIECTVDRIFCDSKKTLQVVQQRSKTPSVVVPMNVTFNKQVMK